MVGHRDGPAWPATASVHTFGLQGSGEHDLLRGIRVLAAVAAALGLAAIVGWSLGVPGLAGGIWGNRPTTPLTGVMIVVSAATLLLPRGAGSARLARVLGSMVALIAVIVLAEYALRIDIEPLRPAPNSALCLVLIGIALVAMPVDATATRWRSTVTNVCGAISLVIALAAVIGDSYGAEVTGAATGYPSMALASAAAIALVAFAILIDPFHGLIGVHLAGTDPGAMIARRLLPAALLIPFVLGVLSRIADVNQWVAPPVGTALRTTTEIVLLLGLTILTARRLRRLDIERERITAEERNARAEAERAHLGLEEQARELDEQARELEATVDELRLANEALDEQSASAEAARAAERHTKNVLDAVIEQIPVGIVLAKIPSGEIVRRNRMGEDIVAAFSRGAEGMPREQLIWRRLDGGKYEPSDYPFNRAIHHAEVIENEEMTARLSDGTPVHVSVSAAPLYEHGEATIAVGVFTDTSTRRAAETAIAERDALLASFFRTPDVMVSVVEADVSPAALARPDVDYRFLLVNPESASALQLTDDDVAGKSARELRIPADHRRSFVELLAEVHRTGKPATVERPNLPSAPRSGNATTWFSIIVSPLPARSHRLPRFCLIATDVSRRRHLEDELRQAQKLEAVGRLAGGIAHDFNNLLTAITGFTRFALDDLPAAGAARDDLEQVIRAAERAGALTHQLLAFSRQQVLQSQVLDLNQVVADIEPMLRRVIGEDIAIHRSLASTLGNVCADRGQIEQVLVTLVVNARDAMPNGGLVTIETAEVYLEEAQIAASQGGTVGPHVMLAVTDTGVGMSAETRDRIFEPFFTTKEAGRGTGLGLATVFGIVRQSGGSIWVYSEPGHGTTFKIYLPRFDGQPEVRRPTTPASVPSVAGRVLLVEDDAAVRTIAARVLRGDGYDVVEAATGREGLATFRSLGGAVDLIVTDLVLPEMGGRAMIQALAAEGTVPPTVYMSGYTAEAMSAQSVLGVDDELIEKPFTPESFLAKVRQAMQRATPISASGHG